MNFTIDRFEGNFAVVETESGLFLNVPKVLLPGDVHEGDVFTISKNLLETENRKTRIEGIMKNLFE